MVRWTNPWRRLVKSEIDRNSSKLMLLRTRVRSKGCLSRLTVCDPRQAAPVLVRWTWNDFWIAVRLVLPWS